MDEPAKPVVKAKKSSFKCPSFSVPAKSTVNQAPKQSEETTGKSSTERISTQAKFPAATVTSGGDSESNLDLENTSTRPPQQNVHISGDSSVNKVPLETAVKKKKAKFEVKTSAEEVAGVKPTKKKDKTEKSKSEEKVSESGMKKEKQKKETKEKKDKTEKSKSEEKAVEPGMKEEKQKKEPKEKKDKTEKSKSEEKAEPGMKKEKQKREPKETLPVKSLTDDEYDAIFDDAIKNAMDLNMEEWEPRITSPIKVREPVKKKYSITVGKKSSEKPKQLSQQSSQATCPDSPQHDTPGEPDEQHEVSVGLDEEEDDNVCLQQQELNDTETSIKDDIDESKQTHDASNADEQDQENSDVEAVDENNNQEEERMDQDDSDNDDENDVNLEPVVPDESAQQENETTPAGSEADSSDKQPDCQKAPVKRKKKPVPKSDKKPKLEPKQLPFDVKKETTMVDQIKEAKKKKTYLHDAKELSKKVKHDQDVKQPSEKVPKQDTKKIKEEAACNKKVNKRQKMRERELDLNGTWVQCCNTACMKWRHLPEMNDPAQIPERWTCSMNPDKKYNSCLAAEEAYDESEHIYTKFTEGSVVWARMVGYPWWPAMVEIDPDVDTYFSIETQDSMVPTHYHVVFFDEKVSRSWVKAGHLKPFTGKEEDDGIIYQCSKKGVSYKKEIATAKKNAVQALSCTIKERIEQFGFAARYKGPWNISKASSTNKISKSAKKQKAQDDITPEDILDDTTMDEVLDNTDILLDNVEEMLDSIDTQIDDSDADSEFIPEDLVIIEGARKRAGRKSSKSDFLKPLKKKAKTVKFNSEDELKTDQQEDEKITKKKESTDSRSVENIISDESEIQESSDKISKTSLNLYSDIFTMEMETQDKQTKENLVKNSYINLTSTAKNITTKKVKTPQEEKKFKKQEAKEDESKQQTDGKDSPKQAESKSLTEMSHNDKSIDTSVKPSDLIMNNGDNGKVNKDSVNEFNLVEDDKKEVVHKTMQMEEITTDNESEDGFDLLGEDDMKHDQEHSETTPGCLVKETKTSEQEDKPAEDEFDLIDVEYIENDGRVVPDVNNTEVKETVHRNPSQGLDTESDTEFNLDEHYMYETVSNASDKVRERGVVAVPVVNEIDEDSDPFDLMEE